MLSKDHNHIKINGVLFFSTVNVYMGPFCRQIQHPNILKGFVDASESDSVFNKVADKVGLISFKSTTITLYKMPLESSTINLP